MGIWVPDDSRVMSLSAKGSSGTKSKNSVSGSILQVKIMNPVRKLCECG